jgi:hypothetical protein
MLNQLLHKILRFGRGELFIEWNDEKMPHPEFLDQSDLMRRSSKQMWRLLGPQDFLRVRIKRHYDGRSIFRQRMLSGSGDNRLMTEMDTIKHTNGDEKRAG